MDNIILIDHGWFYNLYYFIGHRLIKLCSCEVNDYYKTITFRRTEINNENLFFYFVDMMYRKLKHKKYKIIFEGDINFEPKLSFYTIEFKIKKTNHKLSLPELNITEKDIVKKTSLIRKFDSILKKDNLKWYYKYIEKNVWIYIFNQQNENVGDVWFGPTNPKSGIYFFEMLGVTEKYQGKKYGNILICLGIAIAKQLFKNVKYIDHSAGDRYYKEKAPENPNLTVEEYMIPMSFEEAKQYVLDNIDKFKLLKWYMKAGSEMISKDEKLNEFHTVMNFRLPANKLISFCESF